jgi:hypothetical protein
MLPHLLTFVDENGDNSDCDGMTFHPVRLGRRVEPRRQPCISVAVGETALLSFHLVLQSFHGIAVDRDPDVKEAPSRQTTTYLYQWVFSSAACLSPSGGVYLFQNQKCLM